MRTGVKKALFVLLATSCAIPFVTTPIALIAGAVIGVAGLNPWPRKTASWSKTMLQFSVVGLGFGMGLTDVLRAGSDAILYTMVGIAFTVLLGCFIGRLLRMQGTTPTLIAFGTAICGGSAIAAMAPVIKAKDEETAVALATVFSLNAAALVVFPVVGHLVGLSQEQFGLWSALAIHDTSSVVGAAAAFGGTAVLVGTTVKLARAVWIMPCTLVAAWINRSEQRVGIPLFIPGFLAAAALRALFPQVMSVWNAFFVAARQALVITLFLVGAGLSREILKRLGVKPLIMGIILWAAVSCITLLVIMNGLIR